MEIFIGGPGEVVVRLIDHAGQTLVQQKLVVSGSAAVQARATIVLHAGTASGRVMLAPVLVRQSNPHQRVTFDNEPPARFTVRRCQEIGCTTDVMNDIERGCAASPATGDTAMRVSDDQTVYRVIRDAVSKER
jgi:hypothetical protein